MDLTPDEKRKENLENVTESSVITSRKVSKAEQPTEGGGLDVKGNAM
jgi:hypothetical protein